MSTSELHSIISSLSVKDRTLLRLIFVDNIPLTTLLWIYKVRYKTMKDRINTLLLKLKLYES